MGQVGIETRRKIIASAMRDDVIGYAFDLRAFDLGCVLINRHDLSCCREQPLPK